MKKIIGIILLILMTTAMIFAGTSCGKNKKTSLAVKEDAMPQLVHVLGEELDLSQGVLVFNKGKKSHEVAMDADGVSISGYNKNQLGEQTITLSYNGASTTLTVTVVERMQVVDYKSDYLVGDAFDTSKGRLRITRNDGTTYTVILNNTSVSISGFDSSTAANGKTVTAKYTAGSESYETTFTVNIHAVDSISLQAPTKKAYSSHEKGINLDGGRLVLTGNNGTLTREIKLTDTTAGITVEGFDLSVVNEDNTSTNQSINVIYNGKTYSYEIKISYTSVSMIKDHAHEFAGFDWESETKPTISAELGEFALELMAMYADLSTADAILIDNGDLLNIARVAVLYGYTTWLEDVRLFEGAFTYDYDDYYESYSIFVTCDTYADVERAIEMLNVTDRPLYRMYQQLVKISEIESIYDDIIEYIETPIIGDLMFTTLIPMFEHMLDVHDNYLETLEGWNMDNLATYEGAIVDLYELIVEAGYIYGENSWIYEQVAYWYDSENVIKPYDALFRYYYGKDNWEALCDLANVTLPSEFLDIITKLDMLMTTLDSIEAGDVYDNTTFFYDYYAFVEYAKTYENHPDAMVKDIYTKLPVNTLFGYDDSDDIYITTLVNYLYYGYAQIASTLIELPAFENLMDDYLAAYVIAENNADYLTNPEFAAYVQGMTAHFFELSATQQNLFFGAIMPYYYYGEPEFAFGAGEEDAYALARFVKYIIEYYSTVFTNDNLKEAFVDLLVAQEVYTRRFDNNSWNVKFVEKMTAFNTIFNDEALVSAADRELFNQHFGDLRLSCEKVLTRLGSNAPEIAPEWQAIFDELAVAIRAMSDSSYVIDEGVFDAEGYYFYNVFLAAYERAQKLVNIILDPSTPEYIKDAYHYETLFVMEFEYEDGTPGAYYHTLEYAFDGLRGYYVLYRIYTAGTAEDYNALGFPEFFDLAYDLIIPYFNSMLTSGVTIDITKDQLLAIMDAYAHLSPLAKAYHLLMEGGVYSTYYGAISMYIKTAYADNEDLTDLISAITELDYAHSFYYYYTEVVIGANSSSIDKSMDDVKEVYGNLEQLGDIAEGTVFEALYDYYMELTAEMIEAYDAANAD